MEAACRKKPIGISDLEPTLLELRPTCSQGGPWDIDAKPWEKMAHLSEASKGCGKNSADFTSDF